MSAKSQAAKDFGNLALKKLGSIWHGIGKPVTPNVAPTMSKELVPYVPPKPGMGNKIYDTLWGNRSGLQRTGIALAAAPIIPHIPGAVASAVKGYAGLFGGGGNSDAPLYDPTKIQTPEQQYADSMKGVYDVLEGYANQPQSQALLDYTKSLTSGVPTAGGTGGNVQSGFTKQQQAAQAQAESGGGTDMGMSTPVAGGTAAAVDAFTPAGQQAQAAMNNYERQAAAAGIKLTNSMKLQFLKGLQADALARSNAANTAITNQRLQDATTIAAMRQKGMVLPDPTKLRAKAIEYNNLSANDKLAYKQYGINNVNDYVNNYVKSTQG